MTFISNISSDTTKHVNDKRIIYNLKVAVTE